MIVLPSPSHRCIKRIGGNGEAGDRVIEMKGERRRPGLLVGLDSRGPIERLGEIGAIVAGAVGQKIVGVNANDGRRKALQCQLPESPLNCGSWPACFRPCNWSAIASASAGAATGLFSATRSSSFAASAAAGTGIAPGTLAASTTTPPSRPPPASSQTIGCGGCRSPAPPGGIAVGGDELFRVDRREPAPSLRAQKQIGGEGPLGIGRVEINPGIGQVAHVILQEHHGFQARRTMATFRRCKTVSSVAVTPTTAGTGLPASSVVEMVMCTASAGVKEA